jgi:hypothetical protein
MSEGMLAEVVEPFYIRVACEAGRVKQPTKSEMSTHSDRYRRWKRRGG